MDFLVLFLFYLAFLLICVVMICIFTKSQRLKAVVLGGTQSGAEEMAGQSQSCRATSTGGMAEEQSERIKSVLQGNPAVPPEGRADASSSALPHTVFVAQGSHTATFSPGGGWPGPCSSDSCGFFLEWPVHTPCVLPCSHPTFIILHLLLQGLVYAEYTCEVFGYCWELEFSLPYLLLPYVLLSVNLVFFTLTCAANPGTITNTNESLLLQVYKFDDVMFPKNSRCPTCDLRKPARSKHCRLCDRCVHRFDHHCVWVNNCIGAWNTRYFLIYLLTLTASAATIATVTAAFLLRLVTVSDLYQETYLDDVGHFQAVDTVFLIQHLFLAFPRIVFLLGFVIVLSMLLAGYLCFALYLAATNQTTNEWYKGDWAWCQRWPLVAWSPSAEPRIHQNIHSHGFRSNLREIFLPATPSYKKKEK